MHPHIRHFSAAALMTILAIGLWDGARGVVLPHFMADLSLSATSAAGIFSGGAAGYLVGSLCYGALSRRFGLKPLVAVGIALWLTAMGLFLSLREPLFLYAATVLMGWSGAMLELSTGIPISILYGKKQDSMLNMLHGFFGVGALSGSLVAAYLLGLGAPWRMPFLLMAGLLVAAILFFLSLPALPLPEPSRDDGGPTALWQDPLVWIAVLTLSLAGSAEVGMGLWLPTFLQRAKAVSEPVSALALTLFFVGFTLTRLAGSRVVTLVGPTRAVAGLGALGTAALLALIWLPGDWWWISFLAGSGIALGFATCVALICTRHPHQVNLIYSVMYTSAGVSVILTGPFMGFLSDRFSMGAAMWVPLTGYAAMILLMLLYGALEERLPLPPERSAA